MRRFLALALYLLLAMGCRPSQSPANDDRIRAAGALTDLYTDSPLSRWNVRSHAAGSDCGILLVETSITMETAMVQALHYGSGVYDVYRGGIEQFLRDRAFRGVAYKDESGRVWTYGDVSPSQVSSLDVCH